MDITLRSYRTTDFKLVSDFLIANHQPGNQDGNWLQPAWEYMHSHPSLDEASLNRIGIWEHEVELVGVAHYESRLGEAFFQVHPDYADLKADMLEYAEHHLCGETDDGVQYLRAYVNDFDLEFEALVRSRGYEIVARYTRPLTQFDIPQPFPPIKLAEGFGIKSLADDNNLEKIHRVLWRGFNNPGKPPRDGIEGRKKMQSGPNFRKDLTIVVEAPTGEFVSFCGMWYESVNKIAYVEPVATDPDFRHMGLGSAAVLEGIRRCGALGATVAYVGSDQEFYKAIGFTRVFDSQCWIKQF
ncbi:GNAT family N-acetyltransferase [Candidatus Bipolaricaulota bacterium]